MKCLIIRLPGKIFKIYVRTFSYCLLAEIFKHSLPGGPGVWFSGARVAAVAVARLDKVGSQGSCKTLT